MTAPRPTLRKVKRSRLTVTEDMRRALRLLEEGVLQSDIARRFGRSTSTIGAWCRAARAELAEKEALAQEDLDRDPGPGEGGA